MWQVNLKPPSHFLSPMVKARAKPDPTGVQMQLKVALLDIKPAIWRRLLVPATIKLPKLHTVLQLSFGWTNSHLHAFRLEEDSYEAIYADDWSQDFSGPGQRHDEKKFRLCDLLHAPDDFLIYEYDFGDSWQHEILVEKYFPAPRPRWSPALPAPAPALRMIAAAFPDMKTWSKPWQTRSTPNASNSLSGSDGPTTRKRSAWSPSTSCSKVSKSNRPRPHLSEHQISLGLDVGYNTEPAGVPALRDEIAAAWSLPLGQRVEVCFRGERSAVTGILELLRTPEYPWDPHQPLQLGISGLVFSSREIERWTKI